MPHARTHCQAFPAYKFRVSITKDGSTPGEGYSLHRLYGHEDPIVVV